MKLRYIPSIAIAPVNQLRAAQYFSKVLSTQAGINSYIDDLSREVSQAGKSVVTTNCEKSAETMHDISMNQFLNLPCVQRQELQLEIERAIASVIAKYFNYDTRGREGLPDLQYLEVMIANDNSLDNENGITWRVGRETDNRV